MTADGSGIVVLAGTSSYSGLTEVSGGVVEVAGTLSGTTITFMNNDGVANGLKISPLYVRAVRP